MVNNWAFSWDCISPALKYKAKLYQKNVNLDDKKSSHSVKKTQKFKFKWQKKTQTSDKKLQNVTKLV